MIRNHSYDSAYILPLRTVLDNSTCRNASICEQNCALVNDTDQCSCDIGFMLAEDGRSCPGTYIHCKK